MRGLLAGAMVAGASLAATLAWAQGPMTPVRPLSSPAAAAQWIEPPPGSKPAAAPSVAVPEPAEQTSEAHDARDAPPRRSARGSGGSTASRLNRQELARIRSGSGGAYYYRGYGGNSYWPFRF